MYTFIIVFLAIIMLFLIIEMFFMFKLARIVATFLNKIMFIDDKVQRNYLKVGAVSPELNKKTTKGKKINIYDDKYQLLLFKSSTCGTCQEISSHLDDFIHKFKENVEFIVIQKEEVSDAEQSIEIISNEEIFNSFLIKRVPTLFIIGPSGSILKISDLSSHEELLYEISFYLKGSDDNRIAN